MSRLLHAAARGARIECWLLPQKKWIPAIAVRVADGLHIDYRIHPNDEHLQYGPISTALRKNAESFDARHTSGLPYVEGYFIFTNAEADCLDADELHRSLFLLILAEALAEEGL